MRRVIAALVMLALIAAVPADRRFEPVRPGVALSFPRDHGAHPAYRSEWWYLTGWLDEPGGRHRGFQITFFRSATGLSAHSRSAFAPRQILLGHAALSDPALGHLLHGERIAREGLGLAQASRSDADVVLDDWHLRRLPDGRFVAHVAGQGFALDLAFSPGQPILLQGDHGFSRKGPEASSASHYYSMPHLAVSGTVTEQGQVRRASGEAWLDREWSSSYLPEGAVGWDWTGLNFADGGALMAFRIRRKDGSALWAGGTYRAPQGGMTVLRPQDIAFTVRRHWRSARTGGLYPVDPVLRVSLPGGMREWPMVPLFDDQELDGRAAGSPVYWEGAVIVPGGRGYLELTGYAGDLHL